MHLVHITSEPVRSGQIEEQARECINLLINYITEKSYKPDQIVSLTVFLNATNSKEYKIKKQASDNVIRENNLGSIPVNFLAQPPANGYELTIECHLLPYSENVSLERKSINNINYVVAKSDNAVKAVFASGLSCDDLQEKSIFEGAEASFSKMQLILDAENLTFHHIIRQWNYIEHITEIENINGKEKQHYQIFNDIRSKYYNQDSFINGYPAATGIGTYAGGVIISFYAIGTDNKALIKSIENPLQVAAYDYSDKVLIGEAAFESHKKTSPKFVRAKYANGTLGKAIYISGTASIRKEKTVAINNPQKQTEVTFENIEHLISEENLKKFGIQNQATHRIKYYRVYIKNKKDVEIVINTCKKLYANIPVSYVLSDICRDDLLLEIEGIAD